MLSLCAVCLTAITGLSLLLYTALTGVPTLSSSRLETRAVVALLNDAKISERAVIIDLGCGWGTLVVALARAFPDATVRGVEMSPFPYLISRLRTRRLSNVSLRWGSFFRSDLSSVDAVTCYLMPRKMTQVSDLLDEAVRPGTLVVTNSFLFRERAVSAVHRASWGGTVALYVWPARQWVV